MLRVARAGGAVPADVRHRMHAQIGAALGRALHLSHQAEGAVRQAHQRVEQRLEGGPGPRAGDEHGLRPRDGLQQPVLPRQHGLGSAPGALTGRALKHRIDLRRQCEQVVQRRILHHKIFKAMPHGLRRMGFLPRAHEDHGGYGIELLQEVKACAAHGALRGQHDVGPLARQIALGLGEGRRHVHPPTRPGVRQCFGQRLCMPRVAFNEQDGDGHGPINDRGGHRHRNGHGRM